MGQAAEERRALCDLFDELGPDAPTLCEGWATRDLAAHLALRDRRIDAAPGILLPVFAGYTRRVQDGFAGKPWSELVELVRTGPPAWSPFAIPALADLVNTAEYFVHHEDVRRARPGWEPRPSTPERDAALLRALGPAAKMTYRRSPVGVVLRREDGTELTVKRGPDTVAIVGAVGELVLHVFGREEARISFDGDQAAVARVKGLKRTF